LRAKQRATQDRPRNPVTIYTDELKSYEGIADENTRHESVNHSAQEWVRDNGQSARVTIRAKGGGPTARRSTIEDGSGTFSDVSDISELFGTYAAAEAHSGAGESSAACVVTKRAVSLALSGKGTGFYLGVSSAKFEIEEVGGR